MNKYVLSALLGCSLMGISAAVLADGDAASVSTATTVNGNSGVYVGGDLGWGEEVSSTDGVSNNTGFAWGVNGGYQFMPYVAAEVGFSGYPKDSHNTPWGTETTRFYNTYVAVKGMYPFSNGVVLYAKVGPSYVDASSSGVSTTSTHEYTAYGALGVGYNFTPAVQANIQVDATKQRGSNARDSNYFPSMRRATVGASYLFNM